MVRILCLAFFAALTLLPTAHANQLETCYSACRADGWSFSYCHDKCGQTWGCYDECGRDGWGFSHCYDKCGAIYGCYDSCKKDGWSFSYCHDKCGQNLRN